MRLLSSLSTGIVAAVLLHPSAANGQARSTDSAGQSGPRQRAQQFSGVITRKVRMDYLLYLPPDYEKDPQSKWPLMLFLHGSGERGTNLESVKRNGPPRLIAEGQDFPFVIVSPQCPSDQWWDVDALAALLDSVMESYRIDPDRVYLTGLSMGGFGTWLLAAAEPDRFAAIAPICGGGFYVDAPKLKDIPIWAFHGAADPIVPPAKSQEMVEAVRRAGGRAALTLYPGVGHDSWTRTYEDPKLYRWMLSQQRNADAPEAP